MAKWADYIITCVTHTSDNDRISTVGVHEDDGGDTLGTKQTWHRAQVVRKLDDGKTFVTATKNQKGKWTKGASVQTYTRNGETFIRTDANKVAKDNLGNLPSC